MRGRYRTGATAGSRLASTRTKRMTLTALILFFITATLVLVRSAADGLAGVYGVAVFTILGGKLFASLVPPRRRPRSNPRMRVGVVVTIYNEDPELLRRCLDSLLSQTFPPERIVIVDDHSDGLAAHDVAVCYATLDSRITVVRQPVNLGKREGLAVGFRAMAGEVDVFVCVDSDSVLEPNAVDEGMQAFRSRKVTAATGLVLPLNYDTNLLTRLQDVRYANAFLGERAAYSHAGSVLCVCGILAFYRADVVLRHLDDFLTQRFLGRPAVTGDDRRLTNYCLTQGRVVFIETAIAHTAVPDRLGHFVRQQARWGRSFFRESAWVLSHLRPSRAAWWLTLLEVAQWIVFSTVLVYMVGVHPLITGHVIIGEYLVFVGLMATARAVRYFDVRRDGQSGWSRMVSFVTAPLYGYMNLFVMLPLRFWSLVTLRRSSWGTRQAVEVSVQAAPPEMREPVPTP
ncbi:glycosyltransferase family 2 protein [Phytoactinopolyspora endophytica]|uniref:glycosyltransferase family 2 protein n=1 Tax=Phytoactinopolyspora endophytica TaxID=1642495 RepID=UPI0013EDC09F|nr:glycosyltransferase [Phytoactinopolyspora endophytica]